MRSRLVPCYEFDDLVDELGVRPRSNNQEWNEFSGTGWRCAEWLNSVGDIWLLSYTYYDRDFLRECIHLDLR